MIEIISRDTPAGSRVISFALLQYYYNSLSISWKNMNENRNITSESFQQSLILKVIVV